MKTLYDTPATQRSAARIAVILSEAKSATQGDKALKGCLWVGARW
jgi:hypothetical protein